MRKSALSIVPVFFVMGYLVADDGNSNVLAMLKRNSIVHAAVAQGKDFSGATACDYRVESTEPQQFQKGGPFDYSAEITCSHDKAAAIIRINGRMFPPADGPQQFTLSIAFAG